MATKKIELDVRIEQIADEEFADYEKYLTTKQDVMMYRRKRKEYWEKVKVRVREELNATDGRPDDSSTSNTSSSN